GGSTRSNDHESCTSNPAASRPHRTSMRERAPSYALHASCRGAGASPLTAREVHARGPARSSAQTSFRAAPLVSPPKTTRRCPVVSTTAAAADLGGGGIPAGVSGFHVGVGARESSHRSFWKR